MKRRASPVRRTQIWVSIDLIIETVQYKMDTVKIAFLKENNLKVEKENETMLTPKKYTKTILIVEANEAIEPRFFTALDEETPYRVLRVATASEALELSKNIKPHLLLFMKLPADMSGIELYDEIRAKKGMEDTPALFFDSQLSWQIVKQRNIVCLSKPCNIEILLQALNMLISLPKSTISV